MAFDAGTGHITILPDVSKFATRLQSSVSPMLDRIGSRLSSAGSRLTRSVSLPLIAVGAAATKAALGFEDAFTRIAAVSNASRKDIELWREQVLNLAGRTAQAPAELAEALFFLSSAGLDTNQIMPTLASSAKAAAAGLGTTADVARLTANVLNAYAGSGLTAAKATDVLVAAVREGSAAPDEFADAMGRILPVAAKAGITFDQIAASLAAVSNIGLDVDEGVTAMRGLLSALIAPGTQAADTMKEIGLSADELRDSLAQQGLIATLRLLDQAAQGDIDTLRKIVPNIRAMTGAFGLTEQEAEKVDTIFRRVADSTGSLDKAFEETERGSAFKFRRALQRLQVVAIELGQELIPIVQEALGMFTRLATQFRRLEPEQQKQIVKWGLMAIALGPVVRLLGAFVNLTSGIVRGFGLLAQGSVAVITKLQLMAGNFLAARAGAITWRAAIAQSIGPLGAYAAAITSVGFALHELIRNDNQLIQQDIAFQQKWLRQVLRGQISLEELSERIQAAGEDFSLFDRTVLSLDDRLAGDHVKVVELVNERWRQMAIAQQATAEGAVVFQQVMAQAEGITRKEAQTIAGAIAAHNRWVGPIDDVTEASVAAWLRIGDVDQAVRILTEHIPANTRGLRNMASTDVLLAEKAADAGLKIKLQADYTRDLQNITNRTLGALRNMLSYEQQLAEAAGDFNQKLLLQAAHLRGIAGLSAGGVGGGGRGGGGAGGPSGQGGTTEFGSGQQLRAADGDVHITVELDGEKVARAVARRAARRRALVGA